jgi:ornithine cyclodeaminase/alanine dehydrogenase-like protein (mu-crystallin family)
MLLLSNEEVASLLSMPDCLEAVEDAYRELGEGRGASGVRSEILTPTTRDDGLYSLLTMAGAVPKFGIGAVRINSDILTWPQTAAGRKRVKIPAAPNGRYVGLVLLFSIATGEPLAIYPDGIVQRLRVGATTGLGAKYLAREDASEIAMLGCGWQAGAQILAMAEVRKVSRVRCFSPNAERRAAFAQEMRGKTGIEVVACETAQDAVRGADVVLCATNSWSPVFHAGWLEPGMHVSTVQHAELDPAVFNKADVLIGHYTAGRPAVIDSSRGITHADETEELRKSVRAALAEHKLPNLHDLVLGRVPGRTSPSQITCFLNYVGLGYQFAAVGSVVYRKALEQGVGRDLPTDWFTEDVNP